MTQPQIVITATAPESDHIATLEGNNAFTGANTHAGTETFNSSTVLNGALTGTFIKDEDNMASDSATAVASQQSTKAYADTKVAKAGDIMTGDLKIQADNKVVFFGAGDDMSVGYDGTQGNIKTDLVAPSDLHLDCGTDKTMVLDETVWNDMPPMNMMSARVGGANNPTLNTLAGNIQQLTFAVDDYVYANSEVFHDYKEGTDIEMHIHTVTNGTNVDNRYVRYEVEYWMVDIDGASAALTGTADQEFLIPANTADRTHLYFDFSEEVIAGASLNIGAYLCIRLKRLTSVGTAPTNDPFVLAVGAHYQIDTLGSRQEHTK